MANTPPLHFMHIIDHDTLRLGKFQLPAEFVSKYGRRALSGPKVVLEVPTGDSWSVRLEKSGRIVSVHGNGWQSFMKHYSVALGSLLVFKWCRESLFKVVVFDVSQTEIDYPPAPYADTSPDEGITTQDDSDSGEEVEDDIFANTAAYGTPANPIVFDSDEYFRNIPSSSSSKPKSKRTSQAKAGALPSFQLTIRKSYILDRKSRVTIPGKFVKANKLNELETPVNVHVRLVGSPTKTWMMRYLYRGSEKRGEFSNAGWHTFHREAGLCVGDKCVFELTAKRIGELFFTVSIVSRA